MTIYLYRLVQLTLSLPPFKIALRSPYYKEIRNTLFMPKLMKRKGTANSGVCFVRGFVARVRCYGEREREKHFMRPCIENAKRKLAFTTQVFFLTFHTLFLHGHFVYSFLRMTQKLSEILCLQSRTESQHSFFLHMLHMYSLRG